MLKHLKERRQSEEGFTLIELMVVVLIMGILMAIAIPTFLATQGSAHDASAKSNATNALTNEKAYYESNQVFLDAPSATNGNTLDSNLPWGATTGTVAADGNNVAALASTAGATPFAEITTGTTGQAVLVESLSKSDNCFYIFDNESVSPPVLGYAESSGGCSATPGVPTAAQVTANAGQNAGANIVAGAPAATNWYASW
jgi:type IV pilus assembly protein PilA